VSLIDHVYSSIVTKGKTD